MPVDLDIGIPGLVARMEKISHRRDLDELIRLAFFPAAAIIVALHHCGILRRPDS